MQVLPIFEEAAWLCLLFLHLVHHHHFQSSAPDEI